MAARVVRITSGETKVKMLSRAVSYRRHRRGLTLVEMLVAMAVSLILILGIAQLFQYVGESVADGRATIEMAGQLRGAAYRLQEDLEGLTIPVRPWPDAASGMGYIEIMEGLFAQDAKPTAADTTLGDWDDVFACTTRSTQRPFVGQILGTLVPRADGRFDVVVDPNNPVVTTIQSQLAEVVCWTRLDDKNGNLVRDFGENYVLHRREFLIRPDLVFDANHNNLNRAQFLNVNDVSIRRDFVNNVWLPNSLADLTKRENRFAHNLAVGFPYPIDVTMLTPKADITIPLGPGFNSFRQGEDVMLSQVVGFDLKVYDVLAPWRADPSGEALVPGDPGFGAAPPAVIGRGAFVDLFYRWDPTTMMIDPALAAVTSVFSGVPNPRSGLSPPNVAPTYCSWSLSYEHDGIDQNNNTVVDEGTNGFDDDTANGVDDAGERETSPPYPVPLRGMRMQIRIIENDTRQVRQVTVTSDFTPE